MNTRRQILELERLRDLELASATRQFSRLKRDARRAVSPARLIRKNMPLAIGVAVAAGVILAPAPRYVRPTTGTRRSLLHRITPLAARFFPQLRDYLPAAHAADPAPAQAANAVHAQPVPAPARPSSPWEIILHRLASEIDWPLIATTLIARLANQPAPPEPEHSPEHSPDTAAIPDSPVTAATASPDTAR